MGISTGPANNAIAVTTSDTNSIAGCRALWIGGTGNLTLNFGGSDVVIASVPAGTLLPVAPRLVKTATTATSIVALY